jgi:esterase/lipase superfamily enzyme
VTAGCSLGAFHALNFTFKRADIFPLALCFSGNYDPTTWHGRGQQSDALYFNNPVAYLPNLHGAPRRSLRTRLAPPTLDR